MVTPVPLIDESDMDTTPEGEIAEDDDAPLDHTDPLPDEVRDGDIAQYEEQGHA